MRYSTQTTSTVTSLDDADTRSFITEVEKAVPPEQRGGSILLVGGSDFRSVALRRAQSALRFDMRASYWSHAAVLTEWPEGGDLARIKGVEATLEPADVQRHDPARNGVTAFHLERYVDQEAYPNLCIAVPTATEGLSLEWRQDLFRAAAQPNSGRPQYAFHAWLAEWVRFAMLPSTSPNPLFANTPIPSAAFVDFVYASARINLLASATTASAAPEHLWSTLTHWTDALASKVSLKIFRRVRDTACPDAKVDLR